MDIRGALSEPGALGVQSVTTLITYISPPIHILVSNFQSHPLEHILMSNHMLICPNEARVLTIQNSKEYLPQKHTLLIIANRVVPSSFTSLLLSRLAIAVNYRGQNRYEFPFPRCACFIDVRWPLPSTALQERYAFTVPF